MKQVELELRILDEVKRTEEIISMFLPDAGKNLLNEACCYSVNAGGKRLRPIILLNSYRLFGGKDEEIVYPLMAAIEFVHTYSLVHDDLPCMDNDEFRRGKKTTHAEYGYGMGLLAGDALLNYAFETALKIFPTVEKKPDADILYRRAARALSCMFRNSGIEGMIFGQVVDTEDSLSPKNKEELDGMYINKTGALFAASLCCGAIMAGADDECIGKLNEAAKCFGLAFQYGDDILDETSSLEELGKPVHSDERNEKVTSVSLFGIYGALARVEKYTARAVEILNEAAGEGGDTFLAELFEYLIHRRK